MSIRLVQSIREDRDLLHQAVLLALSQNRDICTLDPIHDHAYSPSYMICELGNSHCLFNIKTTVSTNIEFTEHSSNTEHKKYSVFHNFKYRQYQRDSAEDKKQIQDLAKLILYLCKERMHSGKALHERPLDHMDNGKTLNQKPQYQMNIRQNLRTKYINQMGAISALKDLRHKIDHGNIWNRS